MCWGNHKRPTYKIAEKDIITYKILTKDPVTGCLVSPIYGYFYIIGEKQPLIKIKSLRYVNIHKYSISEGYHSYTYTPFHLASGNNVICECIIPKGTRMSSVDHTGAIVSETIILKGLYNGL